MDDPTLGRDEHLSALRGLARINLLSRAASSLWPAMASLAAESPRPLTVLDVASGSGDLLARLIRRSRTRGLDIRFTACDISAVALEQTRLRGLEIETIQQDVIGGEVPGEHDVVMSSLFLHHLANTDIVSLLRSMDAAARRAVLISDLNRTHHGLVLAHLAPRILTRSRVVHSDAVLSARAALTIPEISQIAAQAGLSGAKIVHRFPSRWLLVRHKSRETAS